MKEGIHPNYREVCFMDLSNNFKFVTRSCVNTKEMVKMEDGREYPCTSSIPPANRIPSTPARKNPWITWVAALSASVTALAKPPPRTQPPKLLQPLPRKLRKSPSPACDKSSLNFRLLFFRQNLLPP